jgi:hypothetical protein
MKGIAHPSDALLLGWFDAELAEKERAEVEAHLAGCQDCCRRARGIEEVSGAVAAFRESVFQAAAAPVRQAPVRLPLRYGAYALGSIAAAVLMVMLLMPARRPAPVAPLAPAPAPASIEQPRAAVAPAPRPKAAVTARRVRPVPAARERQRPVEFLPLPFSDEALPISQAAIIRVELPRSALRLVGVPVEPDRWDDRVQADVVVGVDGLARAIRFIE